MGTGDIPLGGNPAYGLASHPGAGGVAILLGLLNATETGNKLGRVGFWFVCTFTFTYGMPRGQPLSIYARFLGKKRTSLYISREKGDYYYIQTRHNDLFSHCNLCLEKL